LFLSGKRKNFIAQENYDVKERIQFGSISNSVISIPIKVFGNGCNRREGRKENGVKNLSGAKPFPKTCSYQGFGNAYTQFL